MQTKKMLSWKSLACLCLLGLAACTKTNQLDPNNSPTDGRKPTTESAGDGKLDLLGYGYDVTGEYANSSASKFTIINVEAFQRDNPTRVEIDQSSKQEGRLTAGENAKSYLEKKSFNIKGSAGIGAFKGSISASFSSSDAFSSKYVYSSFDLIIQQKRIKINADLSQLKQYLQPSFLADVQNRTAQQIVQTYGTHVLTDIILGAKLEVLYQSETTKSDRTKAAEAGVDVGVGKLFSINTGFSNSVTETASNFSQKIHYKTYGGEPSQSLIGDVPIGTDVPKVNISNWQGSSTLNNAELIDFGKDGLLPLYDFIDDPTKKAAVKAYIEQYLKDNEVILIPGTSTPPKVYVSASYERYDVPQENADLHINVYADAARTTRINANNLTINYRKAMKYDGGIGCCKVTYFGQDSRVVNGVSDYTVGRMLIRTPTKVINGSWWYGYRVIVEILPGQGYEPVNIMKL